MKKHTHKKLNRTSQKPKCNRDSSERIKSPNFTPKKSKFETKPNSKGAYFQSKKPNLPKEVMEETEKEKFIKKFGGVIIEE